MTLTLNPLKCLVDVANGKSTIGQDTRCMIRPVKASFAYRSTSTMIGLLINQDKFQANWNWKLKFMLNALRTINTLTILNINRRAERRRMGTGYLNLTSPNGATFLWKEIVRTTCGAHLTIFKDRPIRREEIRPLIVRRI